MRVGLSGGTAHPPGRAQSVAALHAVHAQDARTKIQFPGVCDVLTGPVLVWTMCCV